MGISFRLSRVKSLHLEDTFSQCLGVYFDKQVSAPCFFWVFFFLFFFAFLDVVPDNVVIYSYADSYRKNHNDTVIKDERRCF